MVTKKELSLGAAQDTIGLFQAANGGTLFLDEAADLPLAFRASETIAVRFKKKRYVPWVALPRKLWMRTSHLCHAPATWNEMMERGEFRQDLYYRLNVIQLKMPALRDRPEDIPELMDKLLTKLCATQDIDVPKVDGEASKFIQNLHYAGNVRELENMLERALALCDGEKITVEDLMGWVAKSKCAHQRNLGFEPGKTLEISLSDYLEDIEKARHHQGAGKSQ